MATRKGSTKAKLANEMARLNENTGQGASASDEANKNKMDQALETVIEPPETDHLQLEDDEEADESNHDMLKKKLSEYQVEVEKLHQLREKLVQQAKKRDKENQAQKAIRQAEEEREQLLKDIKDLQKASKGGERESFDDFETFSSDEELEEYDSLSPLTKQLQQKPWPTNYKPKIPEFNGKTDPRKFIASYETAILSANGDAAALAKSLILALDEITDLGVGWRRS